MRFHAYHFYIAAAVALVAMAAALAYEHTKIAELESSLAAVESALSAIESTQLDAASSTAANAALINEIGNREVPVEKTENQLLQEAVAKVTPAVVSIVGTQQITILTLLPDGSIIRETEPKEVAEGTGFFVRSNGYIVTNKHVVDDEGATYEVILTSGKRMPAAIVWVSPDDSKDLAILKIEGGGYPRITLGNSNTLSLAQTVFAVGNALGRFSNSVSVGVISGLNRDVTASGVKLTGVIQTDAAINQGNSGGPLVNLAGEAVGISVALARGSQNVAFALPINDIKSALAALGI